MFGVTAGVEARIPVTLAESGGDTEMTLPQFLAHLKTFLDANEFILRDLGGLSAATSRNTYDSATLNATSSSPPTSGSSIS